MALSILKNPKFSSFFLLFFFFTGSIPKNPTFLFYFIFLEWVISSSCITKYNLLTLSCQRGSVSRCVPMVSTAMKTLTSVKSVTQTAPRVAAWRTKTACRVKRGGRLQTRSACRNARSVPLGPFSTVRLITYILLIRLSALNEAGIWPLSEGQEWNSGG